MINERCQLLVLTNHANETCCTLIIQLRSVLREAQINDKSENLKLYQQQLERATASLDEKVKEHKENDGAIITPLGCSQTPHNVFIHFKAFRTVDKQRAMRAQIAEGLGPSHLSAWKGIAPLPPSDHAALKFHAHTEEEQQKRVERLADT